MDGRRRTSSVTKVRNRTRRIGRLIHFRPLMTGGCLLSTPRGSASGPQNFGGLRRRGPGCARRCRAKGGCRCRGSRWRWPCPRRACTVIWRSEGSTGDARPTGRADVLITTLEGGWGVIASNYESARPPARYFNLRANPVASLEVDGVAHQVRVAQVQGSEKERVREAALGWDRGYTACEERSGGRDLGCFVLHPEHD